MPVPIVQGVDVAIFGSKYLDDDFRKIVGVRLQVDAFVGKRPQDGIPVGLQLIVEKNKLIVTDVANPADDAAALAIFDTADKSRAFFQRRPPGTVFHIERLPYRIAVLKEVHDNGGAIGAKSHNLRYIDCSSSGSHQRQAIVLARFDLP